MEANDPLHHYQEALTRTSAEGDRLKRNDRLWIGVKLALFFLLVMLSATVVRYRPRDAWTLLVVLALLVIAFVLHERVLKRLERSKRLKIFYEQGLRRLKDQWAGQGQSGAEFAHDEHLYARDLDVFGAGGLFELLSIARTSAGRETLASWLMAPVPVKMIRERQEAVKEFAPRYAFREAMVLAGGEMEAGVDPEHLAAWSESPGAVPRLFAFVIAPLLAVLWIASIVLLVVGTRDAIEFVIGMSVVNYSISYLYAKRTFAAADDAEEAASELTLLAAVLELLERENFAAEMPQRLQGALSEDGKRASATVRQLNRRAQWLESRHNMIVRFVQPFIFWTPIVMGFLDAWRARHGQHVRAWLMVVGEMEALHALACYAWERPQNTYPEFVTLKDGNVGPLFDAEGLTHPLLPVSRAVANDVYLDGERQLIMLSGPNMAGKSTLLRAIGLNAVLAQAGAPVCAKRLRMSPLLVAASICVLDSLQGGLSRFYAEIQRLKQMQDLAEHGPKVLFLLDELLSGTNSNDRRTGTEAIVRTLLRHGAIGMVTTHDLALTEIVEQMKGKAANYHFEDHFDDGELIFNYRMVPGVVQTTNALKLMRSVGLDVETE